MNVTYLRFLIVQPENYNYTVVHRKDVTLKCNIENISGDWIPSITWSRLSTNRIDLELDVGGAKVEWSENRKILTSSLTIKCATEADAGVYNCILRKKTEGLKSADMHLKVLRSKHNIMFSAAIYSNEHRQLAYFKVSSLVIKHEDV